VKTNRDFLAAVLNDTDFAAGAVDTGFIERHLAALTAAEPVAETILALAAVWQYLSAQEPAGAGLDRHSPWAAGNGWRVNDMPLIWSHFMVDDAPRKVSLRPSPKGDFAVTIGDWQTQITGAYLTDRGLWAEIAGHGQEAQVALTDTVISLVVGGQRRQLTLFDPLATSSDRMIDLGQLTAPMPGRVLEVAIAAGGRVRKGDKLLILEAMKMEHAIKAPAAGVVKAIHVSAGAQVAEGTELIHFEADES
jgi:3-methylcrotonyl-CoA carboxylase alpha subunit